MARRPGRNSAPILQVRTAGRRSRSAPRRAAGRRSCRCDWDSEYLQDSRSACHETDPEKGPSEKGFSSKQTNLDGAVPERCCRPNSKTDPDKRARARRLSPTKLVAEFG